MFPDRAEADRAIEAQGADEPFPNIILRPLAGPAPGTTSSPVDIVMGLFGKQGNRNVNAVPDADMYICLVFSAQVGVGRKAPAQLKPNQTQNSNRREAHKYPLESNVLQHTRLSTAWRY